MATTPDEIRAAFGEYLPFPPRGLEQGSDLYPAIATGLEALKAGSLSWARLNQLMHRCSQAGMSEGCFRYYFLEVPLTHPYPVEKVLSASGYKPPQGVTEITSLEHARWGFLRFMYDAMLYWGNFRQGYRDMRLRSFQEISTFFSEKRVNEERIATRGRVAGPNAIPQDHRYLISEMACKTYEAKGSLQDADHVRLALEGFRVLQAEGAQVTPELLRTRTKTLAEGKNQQQLFELMFEDAPTVLQSEDEVVALYSGQWNAFQKARVDALENTRVYLSLCNDLDVYVATSMRTREDFRGMASTCEQIFNSPTLIKHNVRYFDPTLSAAEHHEDKGIIECLMVKTAKVVLYFAQHKESLGKVSEYAMALSLGKPVIILCPDDPRGREIYAFYRDSHPLTRLVEFKTGIVNGAMVTFKVDHVIRLLDRIFTNTMEYDLGRKEGAEGYYLLRERLTGTTVRVVTDNKLLTEAFWNNWHEVY
ncbi:MAG: hypothetical protein LAN63_04040 [Acidobacteriia bacterium]|nr:hypothetical protein [Terriglobia bacterium]